MYARAGSRIKISRPIRVPRHEGDHNRAMRTFDGITSLRAYLRAAREDDKTVGFVPTMGAFHEGHITLMRRARTECDVVVVSVFVNPTQFAAGEDFERYPRQLAEDSRLAQQSGVDALFAPPVEEIYPTGGATF